jgi:predicted nucleotidyltransferase
MKIAKHFLDFLEMPLQVKDITVSGSNAGYNYSEYSDLDLHLVVAHAEEQRQLFDALKNQYNSKFDIKINDVPVELYVQDASQTHHSAGIYSVKYNEWISKPVPEVPKTSAQEVKSKARNYAGKINTAMRSGDLKKAKSAMDELRRLRKAGLETGGEGSVENLAFKLLRARGQIDKLRKYIDKQESASLSIGEENED